MVFIILTFCLFIFTFSFITSFPIKAMRLYINTEEFIVPKMMPQIIPRVISGL